MNTGCTKSNRRVVVAGIILMAGLVLIIYSNSLNAPFVFDDHHFVKNDPTIIMDTLTWETLKEAALHGRPTNRLLPNMSFALNYFIHGFNVTGYHLVNIGLHLLTAGLLFLFILQTLYVYGLPRGIKHLKSAALIGLAAAIIWAVHPVHTQTVTYIYQRMTSMSALFFILSLLLYIWGRCIWRNNHKITPGAGFALLGCILSGVFAIISKQNAGMLPILILLYEWFFFQDLSISFSKRQIFWIAGGLIIFAAITMLYLGSNPFDRILAGYKPRAFNLTERVLTEWRVVIYYITLFFYPFPGRLNLDHDYPLSVSLLHPVTTVPALGAILALICLSIYLSRRHRLLAFCVLWFILNLIIESSIIGIEIIFEHRTYMPFMLLPLFFVCLVSRYIRMKSVAVGALCSIALVFSVWTYQRNITWQDGAVFAKDRLLKSPYKARPNMEMGVYMAQQKEYARAIQYLHNALRLNPTGRVLVTTYNNLGNVMAKTGKFDKAIQYYQKSLALAPNHQSAKTNLEKVRKFLERNR